MADGTAGLTSLDKDGNAVTSGSVDANFTVMDKLTNQIFVYFYGDVDGNGAGLITEQDPNGIGNQNRDTGGYHSGLDWDLYIQPLTPSAGQDDKWNTTDDVNTPTALNTALGVVINSSAKTHEFSASFAGYGNWNEANINASSHALMNSNTSRLASLEELLSVYAANFSNTIVGSVEPITPESATSTPQQNKPGPWPFYSWSADPTPSGHAATINDFGFGLDSQNSAIFSAVVVL